MTTITVTYGADDVYQFAQAHLAPVAWTAIDDALNNFRNHYKHSATSMEQCFHDVELILREAQLQLHDTPQ